MHNIRLYKIYYHMKSRCYNKNEKNYKIQNRNRRGNKYYTINCKTCCLAEWCEILNLNQWTVRSRLRRGSSIEKALGLEVKNP